jgi:hypothetical protein
MLRVHFFDVYRSLTGNCQHVANMNVVNIYKCFFAFLLPTVLRRCKCGLGIGRMVTGRPVLWVKLSIEVAAQEPAGVTRLHPQCSSGQGSQSSL